MAITYAFFVFTIFHNKNSAGSRRARACSEAGFRSQIGDRA
jgi:hypothetical protein